MKFIEVLALGFDFYIGPVVTLTLEVVKPWISLVLSAFLGVGPVIKSPRVSNLPLCCLFAEFRSSLLIEVVNFILKKRTKEFDFFF